VLLAAVRLSALGTKRTFAASQHFVRYWGTADIPTGIASIDAPRQHARQRRAHAPSAVQRSRLQSLSGSRREQLSR
jgi:hypothetical protein